MAPGMEDVQLSGDILCLQIGYFIFQGISNISHLFQDQGNMATREVEDEANSYFQV
jgi:hypothetical protein